MLGFKPVGQLKTNNAVAAPAQLMWLHVGEIRRQIDRFVAPAPTNMPSVCTIEPLVRSAPMSAEPRLTDDPDGITNVYCTKIVACFIGDFDPM